MLPSRLRTSGGKLARVRISEPCRSRVVVGEEEGRVLFRLGAAVEMTIEEREDSAGRVEELVVVAAAIFAAGHESGHG